MSLHSHGRRGSRRNEDGYVLLTLILMVSLLILAAAAIVPTISFEIRRDREEEMIHRGVQYSRAIRIYFKKLGAILPSSRISRIQIICVFCGSGIRIPSLGRTLSCCVTAK